MKTLREEIGIQQSAEFDSLKAKLIGCKSCGGLNGLHQKGCKA